MHVGLSHRGSRIGFSRHAAAVVRQPYNRGTTTLQNLKLLSPCIGDEFYTRIICSSIEIEDKGFSIIAQDKSLGR